MSLTRQAINIIDVVQQVECILNGCDIGCTDENACNYNPNAGVDNGSCSYFDTEVVCDCDGSLIDVNGDCCSESMMDDCYVCNGDGTSCITPVISDIDNNTYETVQIGDQLWMQENLKTTHFNNGDVIPNIEWDDGWTYNYEPACADYGEDTTNSEIYGKLYNGFAVDDERGICPEGWRIPSAEDYYELSEYLGGDEISGYKMKDDETWDGSNQSNFTGIAGGCRDSGPANGDCCMGILGHFWTSTGSGSALYAELESNKDYIQYKWKDQRAGKSVRCIEN